jgi:hypothetical protein
MKSFPWILETSFPCLYWGNDVLFHFLSCLQAVFVATLIAVAQAGYLGGGYAAYSAPAAYAAPAYHAAPTYAAPAIVKTPVAYKAAPAVDYYVSTLVRLCFNTISCNFSNRNIAKPVHMKFVSKHYLKLHKII